MPSNSILICARGPELRTELEAALADAGYQTATVTTPADAVAAMRGRRVDLSNIRMPVLNLAGKKDHLVFLSQAEVVMDLISSEDKEFIVLDAGHVGLLTGRGARKSLWPQVRDWLEPRSR